MGERDEYFQLVGLDFLPRPMRFQLPPVIVRNIKNDGFGLVAAGDLELLFEQVYFDFQWQILRSDEEIEGVLEGQGWEVLVAWGKVRR